MLQLIKIASKIQDRKERSKSIQTMKIQPHGSVGRIQIAPGIDLDYKPKSVIGDTTQRMINIPEASQEQSDTLISKQDKK